jgi:hypothetical protein
MKAYWGSGCTVPRIPNLGTRHMWVVSFTPRPLCPQGKSPWYSLDRSLGGPQSRSRRGGAEKNSQPLPGFEPPIIHHWAIPTPTQINKQIKSSLILQLLFNKQISLSEKLHGPSPSNISWNSWWSWNRTQIRFWMWMHEIIAALGQG